MSKCDVSICKDKKFIMSLGGGMDAVIYFAELADKGIEGAKKTEKSFSCNRDVYIDGENLLQFIDREYPKYSAHAHEVIVDRQAIYTIIGYDMS